MRWPRGIEIETRRKREPGERMREGGRERKKEGKEKRERKKREDKREGGREGEKADLQLKTSSIDSLRRLNILEKRNAPT